MKVAEALLEVTHLFLDTAPVIYYVEENPLFLASVTPICPENSRRVGS